MPTAAPLAAPTLPGLRPRWVDPDPTDPTAVEELGSELGVAPAVARLLVRRGYRSATEAKSFLRPHPGQLLEPTGLADVGAAASRIVEAIRRSETILVHGDYDVDGVCGTAILVRSLTSMGARVVPFVPNRLLHGYDLGEAGLGAARKAGARLIVTTDCGIVAHAAVAAAKSEGIDVIVTDHHAPGSSLPDALAVVNPNRADCSFGNKGLPGAGVAYKLMCAVATAIGFPRERVNAFLDLVAIAIIADLAPLTAENRVLVRWGLHVLPNTPNPGLRALLRTSGLGDQVEVTAGQVGFVLAPRLNAVGRIGEPMDAVRLLLTDDDGEAARLAQHIESQNRDRQALDEETLNDVRRVLEREYDPDRDWGVVLASEGWHPGVIGIVASRIVELIHRPTVLIALGDTEGKGSARSIRGFNLHGAFVACGEHLLRYGGHRAAAGCSISPQNVAAFRTAFNEVAHARLTPRALIPELPLDGELAVSEANDDLLRALRHFAPFGIGNPTPVFAAYGVRIDGPPRVVGKRHLRLTLREDDSCLEAIGFGMAGRLTEFRGSTELVDVAFRLEENEWEGRDGRLRKSLQARIVDLRLAG